LPAFAIKFHFEHNWTHRRIAPVGFSPGKAGRDAASSVTSVKIGVAFDTVFKAAIIDSKICRN